MEEKSVSEKPELKQYLSLPSLHSIKYRFRFLYLNILENTITADKRFITHGKDSLWTPLYFASDVFAMDGFSKCNKCRIHAAFRKRGIATKLTLPRGMRLTGVPVGDTGVWFYSVYGVIQAVLQYSKSHAEQIEVLETFMDTWKMRVDDASLPDSVSSLTLIDSLTTVVPLPEDLKAKSSNDDSSKLTTTCQSHRNTEKSSYILSSGCVVTRQGSKLFKFPELSSEIPVSSQSQNVKQIEIKQSRGCENNHLQCEKNVKLKLSQHHPSPSKIAVKEDTDHSDENIQSHVCSIGKHIKQDLRGDQTKEKQNSAKRKACGHLKNFQSMQCFEESDVLAKLKPFTENLKKIITEHSQCCLKECIPLLLDDLLRLGEDNYYQREGINARKLWSSEVLVYFSRWMGAKFRLMVPEVSKKVDNFKKANFDVIADLPSERQLISELFPPPMWELLIAWMGINTPLNQMCEENSSEECSLKENIEKEHSLLLLLLEFANQALVSGVAHVLYPRFVSS